MKTRPAFTTRAFSLVELLAVVAIIGVLAAIVLATVGRVRAGARASACVSNLRQIGVAASLWSMDNHGQIVPAFIGSEPTQLKLHSWVGLLAPYAGWQKPSATATDFASYDAIPSIFKCPERNAERTDGRLGYAYNLRYLSDGRSGAESLGMKSYNQAASPARTLMVADGTLKSNAANSWSSYLAAPSTSSWGWTAGPAYTHRGQCNVLWLDGHVSAEREGGKLLDEQYWRLN